MKNLLKGLAISASALAIMAPAAAVAQEAVYQFNIPEQDLGAALRAFGQQSGQQLGFDASITRGKQNTALAGGYSADEGLRRLLEGTGLNFERSPAGVLVVQDPNSPTRLGDASGAVPSDSDATAEILVIGRRTLNADIRRSEDAPQPYVVFSADDVARSNATNLEDFLRSHLPMNTQQLAGNQQITAPSQNNRSQINLRGAGLNQTLILVDGRRAPRILNNGSDFTQADINGIPLSAIERIEILPSTAGGIYGGGAVGGVINIIRKRDYNGLDIGFGYGGAFDGGAQMQRAELSGGATFNDGRTQFSFSASNTQTDPLFVRDNDLRNRQAALQARTSPTFQPTDGYTTNIASQTGVPLVLDNGTPIGSTFTSVPVGYAGYGSDNGAALVGNAGTYNRDLSEPVGRRSLRSETDVNWISFGLRHSLTDNIQAFGDFAYSRSESSIDVPVQTSFTLQGSAAGNPFQQAVVVVVPWVGVSLPTISESETTSGTAGLVGRLSHGWTGSLEQNWSRSTNVFTAFNAPSPFSGGGLAYVNAVAAGTIDVFRDVNAVSTNYGPFLPIGPDLQFGPFTTTQEVTTLRLGGPVLQAWGGPIQLNSLLERRLERTDATTSILSSTSSTYTPAKQQEVESAYVEAVVPVVSAAQGIPLIHSLDLQASVRYDQYETTTTSPVSSPYHPGTPLPSFAPIAQTFESTNYTLALRWSPLEGFALRASYGTGFLPASISQLTTRGPLNAFGSSFGGPFDPRRGGQVISTWQSFIAGNPNLAPEESKSISIGAVLTPHFLPGLRLSLDYTQIEKSGEIGPVGDQFILDHETDYPGRVVRGPNLPGDLAGWAGPIISIDNTSTNIARSSIAALDLQADYQFDAGDWGQFRFYTVATHQEELRRSSLPGSPFIDSVGFGDGPLIWRGNAGIDWTIGKWELGWNTQYYDSYLVALSTDNAVSRAGREARQGSETIPSQTYSDISILYRIGEDQSVLRNVELSFGVQNVFDERPPVTVDGLGYSQYGDPRLRRFTVGLRRHF